MLGRDRPDEAGELARAGDDDLLVWLAACRHPLPALVQSLLAAPGAFDHSGVLAALAACELVADCRPAAGVPGRLDQQPAHVCVADLGDRTLPALLTGGALRGHQADEGHQLLGATEAVEVADLRNKRERGVRVVSRVFTHGGPITAAALSADGGTVASAGADGTVRLWRTASGTELLPLQAGAPVGAVALDPTGRLVAVGAGDDVLVFSATTGSKLKTLTGHTDTVTGVAFSPDGRELASSSRDHDARLWLTERFQLRQVLHRHTAFVSGVAFSSDGRWLATAGALKAGLWSASQQSDLPGSFLLFARGNVAPISSVAWSPSGWELATASRDGSIRVVDCTLCGGLAQLKRVAKARLARLDR